MAHLGKVFREVAPGALRRRIRRDQFGMRVFQRQQFVVERVVLRVGDHRVGEDVVAIDVIIQLAAKFGSALRDFVGHRFTCRRMLKPSG